MSFGYFGGVQVDEPQDQDEAMSDHSPNIFFLSFTSSLHMMPGDRTLGVIMNHAAMESSNNHDSVVSCV
jgi:hypothetical protein